MLLVLSPLSASNGLLYRPPRSTTQGRPPKVDLGVLGFKTDPLLNTAITSIIAGFKSNKSIKFRIKLYIESYIGCCAVEMPILGIENVPKTLRKQNQMISK